MRSESTAHLVPVLWGLYALVVGGWFIFVFNRSLPEIGVLSIATTTLALNSHLVRLGFYDLQLVLSLWIAAAVCGSFVVRRMELELVSRAEWIAISSAVGLSGYSLVVMILGGLKLLYPWVAYSLLALPLLWLMSVGRKTALQDWKRVSSNASQGSSLWIKIGYWGFGIYLSAVLFIVLISALGPEIEWDALAVHLKAAKSYVERHGLRPIPLIPQTFFPKHVTMLFTLGMLLHNEVTAKLIHYLLGLLTLLSCFAFANRLVAPRAGLLAVTILVSTPLFLWEMRTAHTELGLSLYIFLALAGMLAWVRARQASWLKFSAYCCAFALGAKYHALFALVGLSALLVAESLVRKARLREALRQALTYAAGCSLGLVPWTVVNWIQARNPFFPFLNHLFASPYWNSDLTLLGLHQQADSGGKLALYEVWKAPVLLWEMAISQTDRFHGNIGPFYLMLLPLLVFRRRMPRDLKLILLFSAIYWILWAFTGQHARYILPILPGLALVSTYAIGAPRNDARQRWLMPQWWRRGLACLMVCLAMLNSPFFEEYGSHSRYGRSIVASLPWAVLAGTESRQEYIARQLGNYPAVVFYNREPSRQKVLFWWNTDPSAFYANTDAAFNYSPFFPKLLGEDAEEMHNLLLRHQISHVIIDQRQQEGHLFADPERPFVQQYLKKVFQNNATIVYSVSPQAIRQSIIAFDFLKHLPEAEVHSRESTVSSDPLSARRVIPAGLELDDSRYCLLLNAPGEAIYKLQLPSRPELRFSVGSTGSLGCSEETVFQVWVRKAGKKDLIFERTLDIRHHRADRHWFDQSIGLSGYEREEVEICFKTFPATGRGCDWNLWADPVIVSQSSP